MKSEWKRTLSVLLLVLITLLALSAAIPDVSAWGLSVTPTSRTALPGAQTEFTVSVTGTIPGNPRVYLSVQTLAGRGTSYMRSFSPQNQIAPFVSTLTIEMLWWAEEDLRLRVWANPQVGGAQSKDITVIVIAPHWDLGITPSSRDVGPGGSTTFTVYVTGAIAGNPNVHLYGSAPIAATFSFSVNDRPAPFTSTMTVPVLSWSMLIQQVQSRTRRSRSL
jgi:hypothetical protein